MNLEVRYCEQISGFFIVVYFEKKKRTLKTLPQNN